MSSLAEILRGVDQLPPFPEAAQRVMVLLGNPEVSARELAAVIQYDPALTANVIRISNSPYYGLRRRIASVDEAVVLMGQGPLRDIVIACSAAGYFRGDAGTGYGHGLGELWSHSIAAALMARLLAPHVVAVEEGKLFTAGLLHDVGKLVLGQYIATNPRQFVTRVVTDHWASSEAEREMFGTTHAEIGAAVLDHWDFPDDMVQAVREHHDQDVLTKGPLSAAVGLSNILAVSAGIGGGTAALATKVRGEGVAQLGISRQTLDHLLVELLAEFEQAQEFLSL